MAFLALYLLQQVFCEIKGFFRQIFPVAELARQLRENSWGVGELLVLMCYKYAEILRRYVNDGISAVSRKVWQRAVETL